MIQRARLVNEPYFHAEGVVRCDCFLLNLDGLTVAEPPALIQLVTEPGAKHPVLPPWKPGDTLLLEPTMSCSWNEIEETGRCYVALAIHVTCEDREGFLPGMVPLNPDPRDFTKDDPNNSI